MTPPGPGICSRLWTRTIDVFSPGTGRRRIDGELQVVCQEHRELRSRNAALMTEVEFLRTELSRVESEMNQAVHETQLTPSRPPHSMNVENTMPLRVVN